MANTKTGLLVACTLWVLCSCARSEPTASPATAGVLPARAAAPADPPTLSNTAPSPEQPVASTRAAPSNATTAEYRLASADSPYGVPDAATVARFATLLRELSVNYGERPERIAEVSLTGRDILRDKRVTESLATTMGALNAIVDSPSFPSRLGKDPYADFLTFYIVHRSNGTSSAAAVANLRGVARELGVQ
jgi:hypothetical protein